MNVTNIEVVGVNTSAKIDNCKPICIFNIPCGSNDRLTYMNTLSLFRCGHECCKAGKRRKTIPVNQITYVEKAVPSAQNTVTSHTTATTQPQQARDEVLFLSIRNHKAVKRPNPTEETNHFTSSHTCEELQAVVAEPSTPATKRFKLNTDDDFAIIDNAFEKTTPSIIMPGTPNVAASKQYAMSRSTTDLIPFDCSMRTSPYNFDDPYTSLIEFGEKTPLDISPVRSPTSQDKPIKASSAQMSKSVYHDVPQMHELTFFEKWLDECVDIIAD